MLTSAEFIEYVLNGGDSRTAAPDATIAGALPEGFQGFESAPAQTPADSEGAASFARRLLEASGFGLAQLIERSSVIRSSDPVARYLPDRACYWPKAATRPYQALLFETSMRATGLLGIAAFRNTQLRHLDDLEAALARLVSEALVGFQTGGEGVTAAVRKGARDETLCIVSIIDDRESEPTRLVCFGTWSKKPEGGLETFQITEQTRFWDPPLAREHLGLLYERQFRKLEGHDWQEAFTTTEERKQAERLLEVCTRRAPREKDIQECLLDLLKQIAKSFRSKGQQAPRIEAFDLPHDHDIGIPSDGQSAGTNRFNGFIVRDRSAGEAKGRLLGYIVYPLKSKTDATRLRKHLAEHNRFHNVLVVYPDADQASLELWQGPKQLTGKLRQGQGYRDAAHVVNLLSRFFVVSKAKVRNPTELAQELAYRARFLRRLALKELEEEQQKGPLRRLYSAFKEALVHDETEEQFADAFAQTLTYGLLTARWASCDRPAASGERFTRQTALRHLPRVSPFLNDLFQSALSVKIDEQRGRLLWLVDDIADLLDRVDVRYVFGPGDTDSDVNTDPVIHFYEPFLSAYDKALKNKRGVFFTPRPVVSYIVRTVHELLQTSFGLPDGLASTATWSEVVSRNRAVALPPGVRGTDTFVCVLDPATGSGTFLYECIEVVERTLKGKWCRELGATDWSAPEVARRWHDYVKSFLLPRLYGYELMMAPYAIAHLKMSLKLAETGYHLDEEDRLNIYLTDSLAAPTLLANPKLADMFTSLATEAHEVGEVKRSKRFTVVVGNPPYLREKERGPGDRLERLGGWVRFGESGGTRALFDDFLDILTERGLGVHAKLSYELSVMFWRLALWLAFDRDGGPGIVGMISPRAYLSGPGHAGMRGWIRRTATDVWITDLGGDNRGTRKSENVFQIETGVAIGVCTRPPSRSAPSANVSYLEITGTASDKLNAVRRTSSISLEGWRECSAGSDVFLPAASSSFSSWPLLTDLFPWQHSGSQFKRLWPIAESQDVLEARWNHFVSLPREGRPAAFIETRDRLTASAGAGSSSKRYTGLADLKRTAPCPKILRYCYRTLDRQWCLADERLADFLRPSLVGTLGPRQVFGATLMSKPLGAGPAISVTNCLPDMDVFCNRGAKDVIPLWRDREGTEANVTSGLLQAIAKQTQQTVSVEELFCYCVAILSGPSYASTFAEDLAMPGIRIPLTADFATFKEGALLGARIVWLQTFGERWLSRAKNEWSRIRGAAKVRRPLAPSDPYPADYSHDADSEVLQVGHLVIGSVASPTYQYSVSGFKVVESWLRYRMAERGGRARRAGSRSVLDSIRPGQWRFTDELLELLWVVEGCVAIWPQLALFLGRVIQGPVIDADTLPVPSDEQRCEPKETSSSQGRLL